MARTVKTKKAAAPSNWLDGAVEVPRREAPVGRDLSKRQRFYRRAIKAAIVLLPLSLLTNIFILGSNISTPSPQVSVEQVDPAARAAATIAVQAWLDSPVSPVPGIGQILSWDGAETMARPEQTEAQAQRNPLPDYDLQIHSFTIRDGLGATYVASIQVGVDPIAGALAFGTPSLMPVAITDTSAFSNSTPWMGLLVTTAPDAVSGAITAWANAFTSGDPDALRLAVQDENGKHTYVPLFNVAGHDVTVSRAAYLTEPGASVNATSTRMVVQVKLTVQWVGAAKPTSLSQAPTITYDVLVERVGTGAPVVVAWGNPGAGATFTAYQNAQSGRAIIAPEPGRTIEPAPATSPSPSAGPVDPALDPTVEPTEEPDTGGH